MGNHSSPDVVNRLAGCVFDLGGVGNDNRDDVEEGDFDLGGVDLDGDLRVGALY